MEITLNKKGQKSQCFQSNEIPFPASPMLARRGTKKACIAASLDFTSAETDGRLLAVRARFSRGWNLVDFFVYLIEYLQTNQLVMAFSGIESGIAEVPVRATPTRFKC